MRGVGRAFQGAVATSRSTDAGVLRVAEQVGAAVRNASIERHADRVVRDVDEACGQNLLGLGLRSGLDLHAAEDAVQEALLRLWLEVRKGVDIIRPNAWAYRTVHNLAIDEHRLRRKAVEMAREASAARSNAPEVEPPDLTSIWALVDRLPTRQRQVLYLRYKADLAYPQIAAILGITASAARAHATFATERLRRGLASDEQG